MHAARPLRVLFVFLFLCLFVMQGMGLRLPARPDEENDFFRDADILQLHHGRIRQPRLHNHGIQNILLDLGIISTAEGCMHGALRSVDTRYIRE